MLADTARESAPRNRHLINNRFWPPALQAEGWLHPCVCGVPSVQLACGTKITVGARQEGVISLLRDRSKGLNCNTPVPHNATWTDTFLPSDTCLPQRPGFDLKLPHEQRGSLPCSTMASSSRAPLSLPNCTQAASFPSPGSTSHPRRPTVPLDSALQITMKSGSTGRLLPLWQAMLERTSKSREP